MRLEFTNSLDSVEFISPPIEHPVMTNLDTKGRSIAIDPTKTIRKVSLLIRFSKAMGIGGIRMYDSDDELIVDEVWSNTPGDEWET